MSNKFKVGDYVQLKDKNFFPKYQGKQEVVSIARDDLCIRHCKDPWYYDHWELYKEPEGIKHDSGKLEYSLIPWKALNEVVKVLGFGKQKYSKDNWQKIEPQRYKDAAMRHLVAIFNGEWLDEESQLPHAAHCICCLLFIIWFKLNE